MNAPAPRFGIQNRIEQTIYRAVVRSGKLPRNPAWLCRIAVLGVAASSCAKPLPKVLECQIQYADMLQRHVVEATTNPYAVPSLSIHGRFDFRAIYVTEPKDLAGLDIYVYQTTNSSPVLIHQLALRPPYNATATRRFGITGLNLLYDERARELQYWCGFVSPGGGH